MGLNRILNTAYGLNVIKHQISKIKDIIYLFLNILWNTWYILSHYL